MLEHSIVFTGKNPPKPLKGEHGMLQPIKVVPKTRSDKLQAESRINFGKVYTVEHNCKVYDFGNVHPDYVEHLVTCWRWVLTQNTGQGESSLGRSQKEREHDDDDDDDDDDYDDDDNDGDDDDDTYDESYDYDNDTDDGDDGDESKEEP